jgi:hypothetical protein
VPPFQNCRDYRQIFLTNVPGEKGAIHVAFFAAKKVWDWWAGCVEIRSRLERARPWLTGSLGDK